MHNEYRVVCLEKCICMCVNLIDRIETIIIIHKKNHNKYNPLYDINIFNTIIAVSIHTTCSIFDYRHIYV